MRIPTFNKHEENATTTCRYCNKGKVAATTPLRRCNECRQAKSTDQVEGQVTLGKRQPAAVITEFTDQGGKNEVFVDKRGKEVDNPGYDLASDPRGWEFTRRGVAKRTLV